jgi:DNA-directed RNA polymerase subunit RPC12/RpoP
MPLTPEMARAGVTPQLMKTTKRIQCPRCGKEFSLFQSRAIACVGCPQSTTNCRFARCVFCDAEFPLQEFNVKTKEQEQYVSRYMNDILANYRNSVGKTKNR